MFCPFCATDIGLGGQNFFFCPKCGHDLPLHPRYVAACGTDGGATTTATATSDDTVMNYQTFLGLRKNKGDERRGFSKPPKKKLVRNVKVQP